MDRVIEIYKTEGLISLVKRVFRHVRSQLSPGYLYFRHIRPRTAISQDDVKELNGVKVHTQRRFDQYIPWDSQPAGPLNEFESGAVEALQNYVSEGDTVVVIGGGKGVTATIAARLCGEDGQVIVYEGAINMVNQIYDTISINHVTKRVEVRHAVVGSPRRLDGPLQDAEIVNPAHLPECDLLEMDCEGAEIDILASLQIRPRHIVVETHGNERKVRDLLSRLEYAIISKTPAETRLSDEYTEKTELFTLVGENRLN